MHAVRTAAGAAGSQALLDGFTRYLRAERGVSALTVDAYLSDVRRFLARRGGSDLCGELTYLHADMAQKERAIARVTPSGTAPGRYRPADPLLAFLDGL